MSGEGVALGTRRVLGESIRLLKKSFLTQLNVLNIFTFVFKCQISIIKYY